MEVNSATQNGWELLYLYDKIAICWGGPKRRIKKDIIVS